MSSMYFHTRSIDAIYDEFETSKLGLTNAVARGHRAKFGPNEIPPPLEYPAWLCCLLPCLLRTESMCKFHEAVPEQAFILREGRWLTMDTHSIVPGDIVKIERGQRVPADIRIIEAEDHCTFDTRMVSIRQPMIKVDVDATLDSQSDYQIAPNMAFLGYLCVDGSCMGVVVSTGDSTSLSKLIRKGEWPLTM